MLYFVFCHVYCAQSLLYAVALIILRLAIQYRLTYVHRNNELSYFEKLS